MNDAQPSDVHFEVDYTYFSEVNGLNPDSIRWLEACERLNLSSAERIFSHCVGQWSWIVMCLSQAM